MCGLLIEPFGIETANIKVFTCNNSILLIEPFGIETPISLVQFLSWRLF